MILKSVIQCHAVSGATVTSNIERPTSNIEQKWGKSQFNTLAPAGGLVYSGGVFDFDCTVCPREKAVRQAHLLTELYKELNSHM